MNVCVRTSVSAYVCSVPEFVRVYKLGFVSACV